MTYVVSFVISISNNTRSEIYTILKKTLRKLVPIVNSWLIDFYYYSSDFHVGDLVFKALLQERSSGQEVLGTAGWRDNEPG